MALDPLLRPIVSDDEGLDFSEDNPLTGLEKFNERVALEAVLSPEGRDELDKIITDQWNAPLGSGSAAPLRKREDKTHPDGEEIEKIDKQTWRYTYKNNSLIKIYLEDEDLPGGRMFFDAEGNEKAV